jgi:hypothetical protein
LQTVSQQQTVDEDVGQFLSCSFSVLQATVLGFLGRQPLENLQQLTGFSGQGHA